MDILRLEASAQTEVTAGDPVSRMLHRQLPRRRAVGMLAALTTSLLGIGTQATETEAKRKNGNTRHRRRRGATQPGFVPAPSQIVTNNADANDTALE